MEKIKKIFNFYVLNIIEIILCLIVCIFAFFGEFNDDGLLLNKSLEIVAIILLSFVFILSFLECFHKIPFIKLIVMLIMTIAVLPWHNNNLIFDASLIFSSLVFLVATIINFIFNHKKKERKSLLPVGYFNEKQLNITIFFFICLIFILVIFYELFATFLNINVFITCIILFIIAFALVTSFFILSNPINKLIKDFHNTCNFEKFDEQINSYLQNNLHPDTKLYLNLLKCNYLYTIDKEKAQSLFESLGKPLTKSYIKFYNLMEIIYYNQKNDYQKALELINNKNNKLTKKEKQIHLYVNDIYNSDKIINNIEFIFPNKGPKFIILNNQIIKMHYYYSRHLFDLALYNAKQIINNGPQLNEFVKESKEIIDKLTQ